MGKAVEVLDRKISNEKVYLSNRGKKAKFQFQTQMFGRCLALGVVHFDIKEEKQIPAAGEAESSPENCKTAETEGRSDE